MLLVTLVMQVFVLVVMMVWCCSAMQEVALGDAVPSSYGGPWIALVVYACTTLGVATATMLPPMGVHVYMSRLRTWEKPAYRTANWLAVAVWCVSILGCMLLLQLLSYSLGLVFQCINALPTSSSAWLAAAMGAPLSVERYDLCFAGNHGKAKFVMLAFLFVQPLLLSMALFAVATAPGLFSVLRSDGMLCITLLGKPGQQGAVKYRALRKGIWVMFYGIALYSLYEVVQLSVAIIQLGIVSIVRATQPGLGYNKDSLGAARVIAGFLTFQESQAVGGVLCGSLAIQMASFANTMQSPSGKSWVARQAMTFAGIALFLGANCIVAWMGGMFAILWASPAFTLARSMSLAEVLWLLFAAAPVNLVLLQMLVRLALRAKTVMDAAHTMTVRQLWKALRSSNEWSLRSSYAPHDPGWLWSAWDLDEPWYASNNSAAARHDAVLITAGWAGSSTPSHAVHIKSGPNLAAAAKFAKLPKDYIEPFIVQTGMETGPVLRQVRQYTPAEFVTLSLPAQARALRAANQHLLARLQGIGAAQSTQERPHCADVDGPIKAHARRPPAQPVAASGQQSATRAREEAMHASSVLQARLLSDGWRLEGSRADSAAPSHAGGSLSAQAAQLQHAPTHKQHIAPRHDLHVNVLLPPWDGEREASKLPLTPHLDRNQRRGEYTPNPNTACLFRATNAPVLRAMCGQAATPLLILSWLLLWASQFVPPVVRVADTGPSDWYGHLGDDTLAAIVWWYTLLVTLGVVLVWAPRRIHAAVAALNQVAECGVVLLDPQLFSAAICDDRAGTAAAAWSARQQYVSRMASMVLASEGKGAWVLSLVASAVVLPIVFVLIVLFGGPWEEQIANPATWSLAVVALCYVVLALHALLAVLRIDDVVVRAGKTLLTVLARRRVAYEYSSLVHDLADQPRSVYAGSANSSTQPKGGSHRSPPSWLAAQTYAHSVLSHALEHEWKGVVVPLLGPTRTASLALSAGSLRAVGVSLMISVFSALGKALLSAARSR